MIALQPGKEPTTMPRAGKSAPRVELTKIQKTDPTRLNPGLLQTQIQTGFQPGFQTELVLDAAHHASHHAAHRAGTVELFPVQAGQVQGGRAIERCWWMGRQRGRMRRGLLVSLGIVLTALLLLMLNVRAVRAADAVHMVSPGDSLAGIAAANHLTMAELSAYNGIQNPNHIVIGQLIRIPASTAAILSAPAANPNILPGGDGYYVIQQGDSLSRIAQSFGMTQGDLMRLNGLDNANRIFVGQTLRLTARVPAPAAWGEQRPQLADAIHVVKTGDTLASIAQEHSTTLVDLMALNGLPNANFIYTGQRLRLKTPAAPETAFNVAGAPRDGKRRISINLSQQTLTAYQGDVVVMHTTVSTGKADTPTVTGTFEVGLKYPSQRMYGPGYDLPGVPWVMYFFQDYAIHGAYWHMNWGTPMSRGCVNMRPEEARMLYDWAAPGTEVTVHY